MPMVFYTGSGALSSGLHTEEQFLKIMHREFTYKDWSECPIYKAHGREGHYQLQYKSFDLPEGFAVFSLYDWLDFSGASLVQ